MRPFKRGPFPPTDFLPDHVRVELLVPRAVERVGDVQPLAIHAELHLTRATVHPLALEAQESSDVTGLFLSADKQKQRQQSREAEQNGCHPS